MDNLSKKALIDLAAPLAKDVLPKLVTKVTLPIVDKFERKIGWQGYVTAGKGFTLFISNEDIDNIIKTVESLKKSSLLIGGWCYWNSKTWNKKQESGFLPAVMAPMAASLIAPVASSLIQPVVSSLINVGKSVTRASGEFLPL